ncbi:pre-mRNA-splicing factor rse1 [Polyplosphaeria fusca]|uniref:Pre-mRNA-splicing factor rse1 n=1 Tax=Polyplosphaeria fusca TaxID=682080 RepID=A0A9P4V7D0_9PLEO|nr:pre-mRNA-splicing factor rse1 [Polyplosphaeria fusca]
MALYALTIQPPSTAKQAVLGDFIGSKSRQQILSACGSRLSLSEIDKEDQRFREFFSQDMFGIIRHIEKFRLTGGTKDMIALSTDSGRLVTLEYVADENILKPVHFETFGKSSIRRVVPGEYLAVDPRGRAIMVASLEKNRLVYILTRTGETNITISSPLEAHKPQALLYNLIALDVGFNYPTFAALEVDFSRADQDFSGAAVKDLDKELVYYVLDLGLNHIVRKWSEKVDRSSNMLFRIPGGDDNPGGLLCCGEDTIAYRHMHNTTEQVHRVAIPRREGATEDPNRKRIIVGGELYTIKGGEFFYILQTDDGDLFKIIFNVRKSGIRSMRIHYFDTIPVASSMCLMKTGYLYCAFESGDQLLYEMGSLAGDESDEATYDSSQFPTDPSLPYDPPFFRPRPLKNLIPTTTLPPTMGPIMAAEVANLTMEDAPQIHTICGTGSRSTFRTTRNAMNVYDLVDSTLPDKCSSIWTSKLTVDDTHDTLIVLSTHGGTTFVLRITDDVNQAYNSGFIEDTASLGIQQFGPDCVIQVHSRGIRHVRGIRFENEDAEQAMYDELTDWHAPAHRTVVACATNNRQVALALSSGEILYFEADSDGSLSKADEVISLECPINCIAIPTVPEGSVRAYFMAVGCGDQSVRIFNLSPDMDGEILKNVGMILTSAQPSAMIITHMKDKSPNGSSQYLHVGLRSGVYIRAYLDEITGDIYGSQRRFLGPEPIRFAEVVAAQDPAILAITSRPWLTYTDPRSGTITSTPLHYTPFDAAWAFKSAGFKGIVTVRGDILRIFDILSVANNTTQENIPLKYTPRKLVGYHEQQIYYVIESDNNTLDAETVAMLKAHEKSNGTGAIDKQGDTAMNGVTDTPEGSDMAVARIPYDETPAIDFGHPKAPHRWASCIEVVDPVTEKDVVHSVELRGNQCALSVALVAFESHGGELFLAVGVATDLVFAPKYQYKSGSVQLYRILQDGRKLEFFHETLLDAPPTALLAFKGRLLVGFGRDLGLFDCGRKSLLRKALTRDCSSSQIVHLTTQGGRIVVSDREQSITFVVHKEMVHPEELIPFADDTIPRYTTCVDMLDYDTTVGGDKFGNIWVLRCPPKISEGSDESNNGLQLKQDKAFLNGTPNRLELVASYFTNDIPISIQKTSIIAGGEKIIFWAGLQGTLGVFIPFLSRTSMKKLQSLELLLRIEDKPVSGRDHLAFRSYYNPVKNVIDGDLVERFLLLSHDQKQVIASQISNTDVGDLEETIANMRGLYAF